MENHGKSKSNTTVVPACANYGYASANKHLQRTRGTARAASVSAVALAFELER